MTIETGSEFGGIETPLTAEQASELMRRAESGDTSVLGLDFGGAPSTPPASEEGGKSPTGDEGKTAGADDGTKAGGEGEKGEIPEGEQNADNTVILARDGKHTIPFDTLAKTRQQRDEAAAAAAAAEAKAAEAVAALEALRAEAAQRAELGKAPTKMDNLTAQAQQAIEDGADAELFGDFSEAALKAGILKLVDQRVSAIVDTKLEPIKKKEEQAAANEHEAFIFGKYPDAVGIVESTQFAAWVNTLPAVARPAIWATFDPKTGGTAQEIVGILDDYTKATGGAKAPPSPSEAAKAAAAQAVSKAEQEPPVSITSIPGARVAGTTLSDQMTTMDGAELYVAMENMTPAQIDAFLNKQL